MMIDTLSSAETAYFLRRALGPVRSWSDFLADCIRDKSCHLGLTLLPVFRVRMPGDRCERPRYSAQQVKTFILAALALEPRPANAEQVRVQSIEVDDETMELPWCMRHVDLRALAESE